MDLANARRGSRSSASTIPAAPRIQYCVASLAGFTPIFFSANTLASGFIPQIIANHGPLSGRRGVSPAITDFIFMTRGPRTCSTLDPPSHQNRYDTRSHQAGTRRRHDSHEKSGVAHFVSRERCRLSGHDPRAHGFLPRTIWKIRRAALPLNPGSPRKSLNTLVPTDPQKL